MYVVQQRLEIEIPIYKQRLSKEANIQAEAEKCKEALIEEQRLNTDYRNNNLLCLIRKS